MIFSSPRFRALHYFSAAHEASIALPHKLPDGESELDMKLTFLFALAQAAIFASSFAHCSETHLQRNHSLPVLQTNRISSSETALNCAPETFTGIIQVDNGRPIVLKPPSALSSLKKLSSLIGGQQDSVIDSWRMIPSSGRRHFEPALELSQRELKRENGGLDAHAFSNYEFFDIARSGLTHSILEEKLNSGPHEAAPRGKKQRHLFTDISLQRLRKDCSKGHCSERNALPMTWLLATPPKGANAGQTVDVNAAPAQNLKSRTFRVAVEEGFTPWLLIQDVSKLLFESNKFERKVNISEGALESDRFETATHQPCFEASEQMLACAVEYAAWRNANKESEAAGICSRWGQACDMRDLIPIANSASADDASAASATHILCAISRHADAPAAEPSLKDFLSAILHLGRAAEISHDLVQNSHN